MGEGVAGGQSSTKIPKITSEGVAEFKAGARPATATPKPINNAYFYVNNCVFGH